MIRFWDFKLTGAPPLLSLVVRQQRVSYRKDGKSLYANQRDWGDWLTSYAELVRASGLPQSVLQSEETWRYFVDRTYSQAGYLGQELWFSADSMSPPQSDAFWQLLCYWLKERWPDAPEHKIQGLQITYRPKTT